MTSDHTKMFPASVLIYNPRSGAGLDRDLWLGTIIDKLCTTLQHSLTVGATTTGVTTTDILRDFLRLSPRLIIAAGGDGTIRHILGALAAERIEIPVGLIPFGTGNQLARNLKILEEDLFHDRLQHAVDVIAAGKTRRIDLGKMNGHFFCVAAGAGPLCDAILTPTQEEKENWGMLAYVGSMIQTVAAPAQAFRVTADGDRFEVMALAVIVSNVSDMGFAKISAGARLDDGYLDLCIITLNEFGDYLKFGFDVVSTVLLGDTPFYVRKARTVLIESLHGPATANIDGDPVGRCPMRIEVVPEAVNVLAPG
jgi:diacylglycerol kinase (ATP)